MTRPSKAGSPDTPRTPGADEPEAAAQSTFRIGSAQIPARPLEPGLYLVATPIGNLGDITLRALETLASADLVACEDTRVSRVLLDRYGIAARPIAYHEHNAAKAGERLLAALDAGGSVALVSDAGTPLVSDPGYRIAGEAIAAGHRVVPIPGASSPLAALVASGLPSDSFFFAGFLPAKTKARLDRLDSLKAIPGSLVILESPHRIAATLEAAAAALGEARAAAVCRELTKLHEEINRGSLAALAEDFAARDQVRGEIVLVVAPPEAAAEPDEGEVDVLLDDLVRSMPPAKAASEAARQTGLNRKALYRKLLARKDRKA